MKSMGKLLLSIILLVSVACSAAHTPIGARGAAYPRIVLYGTAWCSHCKEARDYLDQRQIPYALLDVEEDAEALDTLRNRYRTSKVPLIVIGDDHLILNGFDRAALEQALPPPARP